MAERVGACQTTVARGMAASATRGTAGAWLQALTMDRQGIELTGQADGASALVPLLEASSWLERAELTSPVTKTQDKEQFRIRAAWEKARGSR